MNKAEKMDSGPTNQEILDGNNEEEELEPAKRRGIAKQENESQIVDSHEGDCRKQRAEKVMETKQRKRDTGSMESLGSHGIRAGETERERIHRQKISIQKYAQCLYMCVFNEHFLYKSFQD